MSIVKDCMVVNIGIGVWAGYRRDKKATAKITSESGAESDAAAVNKHLVPKVALKPIITASNSIRSHFYNNTLPWKDNGDRLLTRKNYQKFMEEHAQLADKFDAAVEHFVTKDYPAAVDKAAFRMGTMFDPSDYPTPDQIRRKFYARIDIDAVTTGNDFRVDLDEDELQRIRANIERGLKRRILGSLEEVRETLEHFNEKVSNPEAIFRNSTVKAVKALADMIPETGDPQIDNVRQEIERCLSGVDADGLRNNQYYRGEKANETKAILDKMKGFMAAAGGGA